MKNIVFVIHATGEFLIINNVIIIVVVIIIIIIIIIIVIIIVIHCKYRRVLYKLSPLS